MRKNLRFLLSVLFLVILFLSFYFFVKIKPLSFSAPAGKQTVVDNVMNEDAKEEYRKNIKAAFSDFSGYFAENDFSPAGVDGVKAKILDSKVPAEFKDLHINFLLAVLKIEDFLREKDMEERNASKVIMDKLAKDYSWLNSL